MKKSIITLFIIINAVCYGQKIVNRTFSSPTCAKSELVKVRTMTLREFADSWPVPKNPIEGEMWKQNGHYWLQRKGEMEIIDKWLEQDTLIYSRFIEDSVGNTYEIEYRYWDDITDKYVHGELKDTHEKQLNKYYEEHRHYISLVNIIIYKGNKKKTLFSNIKAIYSPVECVADNRELWLKRLYEYQKHK